MARYSEIGLKSTPVRMRFENRLKDNILSMLAHDGVEAIVSMRDARYFIEAADAGAAVASLKKVFGIASLSVAETCSSDMEELKRAAAEYSRGRISQGQSFAVKARREGNHPYTSMDVGREVGSAIFEANADVGARVDLTNPDAVFYVEVRGKSAYIFGSYVKCHAGLPLGTQGRVIAEADDDRGILSAWLMMKRGCRAYVRGKADFSVLKRYDPRLKVLGEGEEPGKKVMGMVFGAPLSGVGAIDVASYDVPVFFPTVGMTDDDVAQMMAMIERESAPPSA